MPLVTTSLASTLKNTLSSIVASVAVFVVSIGIGYILSVLFTYVLISQDDFAAELDRYIPLQPQLGELQSILDVTGLTGPEFTDLINRVKLG